MELLTAELRAVLPPLYAQEHVKDPIVHEKFFTPDSNWTWYATEGQAEEDDFIFFGFVCGFEDEWGYFALSELQSARGPLNLPIERDLYFQPGPFSEVMKRGRPDRDVNEAQLNRSRLVIFTIRTTGFDGYFARRYNDDNFFESACRRKLVFLKFQKSCLIPYQN